MVAYSLYREEAIYAAATDCDMVCISEISWAESVRRRIMPRPELLARMYHAIMSRLVSDGRAPHYTELAKDMSLSPEEARVALHDLENAGVPGFWLQPGTDYIASFAPFSNIPTQYLISVDGQQKWYGQ